MSFKPNKIAVTAALLLSSSAAIAIPFGSFDTRSMAMGGAGVAVGGASAAPLFNPALLSVTNEKDRFAIILPTVGVRVYDPDNLLRDTLDKAGDFSDALQNSVNALNQLTTIATTTPSSATIAALVTPANNASSDLNRVSTLLAKMSDKLVTVDAGLATVVGIPSKKLGAAFYANATVTAGSIFQYRDAKTLQDISTQLSCLATAAALPTTNTTEINAAVAALNACGTNVTYSDATLQSGIHAKGVALGEAGFALSHEFQIGDHSVAFGITPKIVKAKLFDSPLQMKDSTNSAFNGSDYLAEYTFANFDLGAAKNYDNGWRTGFVLKNVIPQTLDFKYKQSPTGESLTLKPQARIGISHANSWSTVALDVDLTRNDPAGLERGTQYVALGGELNAWDVVQLRAGYRVDMVSNDRSVASVGLGLAPLGVVADLAVSGNANEIGASVQLGFRF